MITVALVTLVALGLTVLYLLRHLQRLTATLKDMREQLDPSLQRLSRDAEVTQAELGRVSAAAEALGRDDGHRP